jgi:hypothetical protein
MVQIFSFFAAFRLLYKNSPDNYSVLSENGNRFSEDGGEFKIQNNAQRHSTRLEPKDYEVESKSNLNISIKRQLFELERCLFLSFYQRSHR